MSESRSEFEKMVAGELYNVFDKDLAKILYQAKRLVKKFNELEYDDFTGQEEILQQLVGKKGKNLTMLAPIYFDYGVNTTIGNNCYFNTGACLLDTGGITIGDDAMIGANVSFLTPLHPFFPTERCCFYDKDGNLADQEYSKPIVVGNNCWIASRAIINPGVTIGDNVVIGSGSVVTRDIPSNVFAAGVPCRVIRPITEADRMIK